MTNNQSKTQKKLDRLHAVEAEQLRSDSLVGSFFHADADRGWQGVVVAEVAPQVYLVELFSWIHGQSSEQQLIRLDQMTGWHFYDDAEWLRNSSDDIQRKWEYQRKQRGASKESDQAVRA